MNTTMRITVNGRAMDFDKVCISYEELVALAGMTGNPSATYCSERNGNVRRSGVMYAGCSPVLVADVMVFNVMHTGGG